MRKDDWFVYMLKLSNESFYTGITNDVARRLKVHEAGKGSKYVRSYLPFKLVYLEDADSLTSAAKRERAIKRLGHKKKKQLVEEYRHRQNEINSSIAVEISTDLKKERIWEKETNISNLNKWINQKEEEFSNQNRYLEKLKLIKIQFADLSYSIDRWKNFRLHSAEVTKVAVDVDIVYSCGYYSDSPLQARPYIEVKGEKIFSIPEVFIIGEKAYNGGGQPLPGWRTKLLEAGISEKIVEKIEQYFKDNKSQECNNEDNNF